MNERGPNAVDAARDTIQLKLATLPAPDTKRWVAGRKEAIVQAVQSGLLSMDDACTRYALSRDEFLAWQHAVRTVGRRGLMASWVRGRMRHATLRTMESENWTIAPEPKAERPKERNATNARPKPETPADSGPNLF